MRGNLVKRSIYLLLVLSMLTIPTAGAASIDNFTDVPADYWGREALAYCVDNGYMQGVGENKMNPDGTLTLAEFVTMLQRIVLTDERRTKICQRLANNGGILEDHWAAESMYIAESCSITLNVDASQTLWDRPVSRASMAVLVDNAMRVQGQLIPSVEYVYSKIPDWFSIQGREESKSILRVYKDGIIIGVDQQGNFKPNDTVTRATAATIAMRIQEPSTRKSIPDFPGTTNIYLPQTIYEGQGTQGRIAQEGDVYIAADGTTITLKVDPLTGVLGWNQLPYIDYYTNTVDDTDFKLNGAGAQVVLYQNGHDHSGMLVKGTQGMFTTGQWGAIAVATKPKNPGKTKGETDSTGLWSWAPSVNDWAWNGPV